MKKFIVTLKGGNEVSVRAKNKSEAIKKAEQGKGRWIGAYMNYRGPTKAEQYE